MKCLVTGYKGFIGTHLFEELKKRGHDVIGCDPKHSDDFKDDIRTLRPEDLEGVDWVFHLGAASGSLHFLPEPSQGISVNALGTVNLLNCCVKAKIKKVVFASTGSSYADTPLPHKETSPLNCPNFYTASKIFGEQAMKLYNQLYGLETIILRYASIYGPGEEKKVLPQGNLANVLTQFIWKMMNGEQPELWHTGEQTRDFTYVGDIVYANIFAAENLNHGIYNVGTGVETKFVDVIKLINKILGTNIEPKMVEATNKSVQSKYVDRQVFDNTKLREKGWNWSVGVEEGIKRVIAGKTQT